MGPLPLRMHSLGSENTSGNIFQGQLHTQTGKNQQRQSSNALSISFAMLPEWIKSSLVETDSDPSLIIDAPLGQIIPLARQHTEYVFPESVNRPFDGLVVQRPVRAVAALTHAARQGEYPAEFWRSALREWPDETRHRLIWLFGARLARLPAEIIVELGCDVFCWLRDHLPKLAAQDQSRALSIFDVLLEKLFTGEAEVGQSGGHRGSTWIIRRRNPHGTAFCMIIGYQMIIGCQNRNYSR